MKTRLGRAFLAAVLLSALPALATVVVAQSIEEMTRAAPLVVRGRVGQVQASWDEGRRRIWTRAEISVLETLKGHAPAFLLVRQPGGEVGDLGQRVSGAAQFSPGEEVVLFLEPAPDEAQVHTVWALGAGKVGFSASKLGERRAVRNLEGLAFYDLKAKDTRPVERVGGPLEDLGTPALFLKRVRAALGGAR